MPVGPYATFDECHSAMMSKGKDDESAKKICGEMEKGASAAEIIQDNDKFYTELEEIYNEEELIYFLWFWIDKAWACSANPVTVNTWQKYIRIHKHPAKQKYHMSHYVWRLREDNSVNLNSLVGKKTLGGIKLTCDSSFRSPEFLKKKADWEQADYLQEQSRIWAAFNKLEQLSNVVFPKK